MKVRFSLQFKLTAVLIGLTALSLSAAGYFSIQAAYNALRHQKQQDELTVARNIAAQVDEVLSKTRQTVEMLSRHPDIRSPDLARQQRALTLVAHVTELIDGFMIFELNGDLRVFDLAEPDTRRLIPAKAFKQIVEPVLRHGTSQISKVIQSASGDLLFSISSPIRDESSVITGILSSGILLRNHSMGGIEGIRIGKTGYAYLVDSKGTVIVHPQRERLLENLSDLPPVKGLRQNQEGIIEYVNKEGVSILAAFAPVAETGWGVVVRQPTSDSYAYAQRILALLLGVLLLSLSAAAGLGVWLAHRIAKPVTDLVRGARRVSEGRLDTVIPVNRQDEIGQLGHAFNEMTLKLRAHLAEIDKAHQAMARAQNQLARSEKLAAMGQLAAGLAHEINNPLNIVSGFAELLLEQTRSDDPRQAHIQEVLRESRRCQRLVCDLLDFAKPKDPQKAPVNLQSLIEETTALLQNTVRSQGIDLRIEQGPDPVMVFADSDQIKQVLLNLGLNACQAMPDGGTLTWRVGKQDSLARIDVSDTGSGIARVHVAHIFNPFFTTKERGTGLGLPISHAFIERHGGRIDLTTEPGKGSTFSIFLPLSPLDAAVA